MAVFHAEALAIIEQIFCGAEPYIGLSIGVVKHAKKE